MKDTSRPHPNLPVRSAPYKKRKSSANVSPSRGTRRAYDTSQSQGHAHEVVPAPPERAHGKDEGQHPRIVSTNNKHRSLSKTGGNRGRRNTTTDGSARERPPHTSALSIHADMPGPSLRLPLTAPSAITAFPGQSRTDSPPQGSVTRFLRSIELPDKPSTGPSSSLRLPPSSTDNTTRSTCANGSDYQISLVYNGYPFTYDLSALPEDPKGTIALLSITKSDPGAYILVGAHYRRTGRSRAACAVIRYLLDSLDDLSDIDKEKGDAVPVPPSEHSTVTLVSPDAPRPRPNWTAPVFKSAAMQPAMLLLAACELDISREHPDDPDSISHAAKAHELFRAVYGTVNDGIIAGAVRPQPKNALGLEFPSNGNCQSYSPSDLNGCPPGSSAKQPDAESSAHVKGLEKELSVAHATQKKLQEKLAISNERLARAEGRVHTLESHSQEMLGRLDYWRDENWELRQRLTETERRAREVVVPGENRVWGRLKDLFDNLGVVRGE